MVPSSKISRAQPQRRGMAAWCSWEQAEDAKATGPAGRGEMQRAREEAGNNHSTERSWWSSPSGVGSPLQWLSLVAGSPHRVYPSRIKPRIECDD